MRIPRHCLERHKNLLNPQVKIEMIHSRNRRLKTKEIYFLHLTSQVSIISLRNVMEINIALFRAQGSVSILGYTMMKKKDSLFCYICSNQYLKDNLASAKNTEQAFISNGFSNWKKALRNAINSLLTVRLFSQKLTVTSLIRPTAMHKTSEH